MMVSEIYTQWKTNTSKRLVDSNQNGNAQFSYFFCGFKRMSRSPNSCERVPLAHFLSFLNQHAHKKSPFNFDEV